MTIVNYLNSENTISFVFTEMSLGKVLSIIIPKCELSIFAEALNTAIEKQQSFFETDSSYGTIKKDFVFFILNIKSKLDASNISLSLDENTFNSLLKCIFDTEKKDIFGKPSRVKFSWKIFEK